MLEKIKLKNSTVLTIGILLIILGIFIGSFEFIMKKKTEVFVEMNLKLKSSEIPTEKEDEEDISLTSEEKLETEEKTENKIEMGISYDYIGYIYIPKINVKTGFLNLDSKYNNVDYNVTLISGSTFPDEKNNNLILAAHSGVCTVCYFNRLFDLNIGDIAFINYNNIDYEYSLKKTYEVDKDGTVSIYRDASKSTLTLITCTKNKDDKQTVFIFEETN